MDFKIGDKVIFKTQKNHRYFIITDIFTCKRQSPECIGCTEQVIYIKGCNTYCASGFVKYTTREEKLKRLLI